VPFNAPDLVAHTRKTYTGPLEVGEDLMGIDIGDKIEIHRTTK
jgi:ribonuclease Z